MTDLLGSMSDEVKAMNADLLWAAGQGHVLPITDEEWAERALKDEKELLTFAQNILSQRTYRRLMVANVEAVYKGEIEARGWYSHRPDTKWGNKKLPFKPDLEVFEAKQRRPPLIVELKHLPIRWQPGQREMVELGFWKLACTPPAFQALLDEWERG